MCSFFEGFYVKCQIILAVFCLAVSCTTSRTVVSEKVNLAKYEYVSIINNDTYHIPAELMEYEIQLFDAVEASGMRLVSDWRIPGLTSQEQDKLLIVKYGVTSLPEETIVTVNFIDYFDRTSCGVMPRCIVESWHKSFGRHERCDKKCRQADFRDI